MSFRFTDEQWDAIRSVRKSWPDHIDWVEFRDAIEEVGREALQLRHNRLNLGPPVKIRNSLRKVMRLRRELQVAMTALPEAIRGSCPDTNLEEQDRLQSWLARYELIAGPDFRGRKDPIRFWLEVRLLARWMGYLDGELSFSRNLDGTPCGPLVEFLTLTLQAILGTAPGPMVLQKSSISTEKPQPYRIEPRRLFNSPTAARPPLSSIVLRIATWTRRTKHGARRRYWP